MSADLEKSKVLIPPPDIKKIIDALATKVSLNGEKFESMIEQHMKNDKKYDFLRQQDNPYRPYYIQELDKAGNQLNDAAEAGTNGQNEIRDLIFGD